MARAHGFLRDALIGLVRTALSDYRQLRNSIGLQRAGFSGETISALKRAYRLFFNSQLNLSQALERARSDLPTSPEVERFLAFVESSERGVPA